MAKERENHPLNSYYKDIYRRYDLVNRIFTFGSDRRWRRKAVNKCLENDPASILDVCTGTGDLLIEIAETAGEGKQYTGYDFTAEMLQLARQKMERKELHLDFVKGDVASMPFKTGSYDVAGIAFGIRNLVFENSKADKHLEEIRRVIKKGGRFVILESSKPSNPVWRFVNAVYLRLILPYLGGLISGNLKAYRYLARSSRNYYSIGEMKAILENAGFTYLSGRPLFLGSVMLVVVEKK